jgi:two-component system sensor histidine kinase BaeS
MRRRAITVDGQEVGWLAWPAHPTAFDIVDRRFQAEQWKAISIVFLIAVVLSAIVAWFLSRGLLAPVKRIAVATRKLADGDYATRVASSSHDELGALVDDFNRLGNALAKNECLRRNFMADVSHELRTPLAILKGELEAIEDGVRPADRGTINSLQAEVARLGKLVDDIHDLSLADVGGLAFHFEDVRLDALVRDAIEGSRAAIEARGLHVDLAAVTPEIHVRADPARLGQLVFNLLANSLQYTNAGGTLRVSLRRHDNKALLLWEDSEPGVPPEALPRLFERLFRVEGSRSRAGGGSGLGLAISRSIVEAHGGAIVARASELGGVCIQVQLPLSQAATA